MRPQRLTVEGFTSFPERLSVDFTSLDLFAITGPTGAGKSSLIDAIVFALYGQVPRVGDDYKQLISHGKDRLSVLFEFQVGDEAWRVARTVRRTGASQQRLERVTAAGAEAVADRAREIKAEVERALGLDYDGFTRSVVLPQGQFDAFLKGEPKERRKILVALLNLGVYERVQQLANARATDARREADFVRRQLETDYAGATPAAAEVLRAELAGAEEKVLSAEAELRQIAEAGALAQQARAVRLEVESLQRDEAEDERKLKAAEAVAAGAAKTRAALQADVDVARQQLESLGTDDARHAVLAEARPSAEQLATLRPRLDRLAAAAESGRRRLDEARADLAGAEASLAKGEMSEALAREQEADARSARDAAHREHAAVALRIHLKPGEPCPVCEQPVRKVPAAEATAVDAADARARDAEARARAATAAAQQERVALEKRRGSVAALERELEQNEDERKAVRGMAEAARARVVAAGFLEIEAADPGGLASRIASELAAVEAARRARADQERKQREAEQKLAALDAQVAAAGAQRDEARARLATLSDRRQQAESRLADARRALRERAEAGEWPGFDPLPAGRDEADVVEALRDAAQRLCAERSGAVARLREAVAQLEKAIVRATELNARRVDLESAAALHRTLADHLKANELVAWVQEEALRRLAEEGSRHLSKLSQGRYALRLGSGEAAEAARADQDFFVVDHWNTDSIRSVRTLSGGETFLASLALALALAEGLAQLSSGGRARDALESLFLDEGFGTLDTETLDTVVSALDALHGGQRMVGIVTHVRDLAERLPARLEVRRQGSGSTASIV